jgi:hypothetical protein
MCAAQTSMRPKDIALACCPPALWALSYVMAKPAIAHFPALFMVGLAYGVGALILLRQSLKTKTAWWERSRVRSSSRA